MNNMIFYTLAVFGVIALLFSLLSAYVIKEKWNILNDDEKKACLYCTVGGFLLSMLSFVCVILIEP